MLCPHCGKPIVNPTWKTCEQQKCAQAVWYAKKHKKSMIRKPKKEAPPTKREMIALMLWQGCSKEHICSYLNIFRRELDAILCNYKADMMTLYEME